MGLKDRIGVVVCGLGVGAHFRRWGFPEHRILEADWGDVVPLSPEFRVHVTTAHHYSGRSLTRNKSLWAGFLLESPGKKVFFSGDSGYGPHFADLGKKSGGVDLALLDCGQYNERWSRIHMTPKRQPARRKNSAHGLCFLRISANSHWHTTPGTNPLNALRPQAGASPSN